MKSPRAAALMHQLVARMGHQNAVVISQKTLSKLLGCNTRTIQRAVSDLVAECWIQAVSLGGGGTINAYVVNSSIAWGQKRDDLPRLSTFNAVIIADEEDQDAITLASSLLRKLPIIFSGERQLPFGAGEPAPFEPPFESMLPDLPLRSYDPETGEIINEEK
jgi:hypothetical protein